MQIDSVVFGHTSVVRSGRLRPPQSGCESTFPTLMQLFLLLCGRAHQRHTLDKIIRVRAEQPALLDLHGDLWSCSWLSRAEMSLRSRGYLSSCILATAAPTSLTPTPSCWPPPICVGSTTYSASIRWLAALSSLAAFSHHRATAHECTVRYEKWSNFTQLVCLKMTIVPTIPLLSDCIKGMWVSFPP